MNDSSRPKSGNQGPRRRGERRGQDNFKRGKQDSRGGKFSKDSRSRGNSRDSERVRQYDDTNPGGPQRSGYREERLNKRINEPDIPENVRTDALDPSILRDLKSLARDNADVVARHLVMVADTLDKDPQLALAHARAAKDRAGRVGVVRETNGIAAYHAGEWKEALTELRAARRISGGPGLIQVMADAERGLGHPEKALELAASPEVKDLDPESRAELDIVLSGAYRDLSEYEQSLLALENTFSEDLPPYTQLRVAYALGVAFATVGRLTEALHWFNTANELDEFGVLEDDIKERLAEINKSLDQ